MEKEDRKEIIRLEKFVESANKNIMGMEMSFDNDISDEHKLFIKRMIYQTKEAILIAEAELKYQVAKLNPKEIIKEMLETND